MQRVRGGRKKLLEIPWPNCVAASAQNPMCRVPARAGGFRTNAALQWQQASWPFVPKNRSLPIASSKRIIGSPKEIEVSFQSQEVGFFQPNSLSFRLIRGVDDLLTDVRTGRAHPPRRPASLRTTLRNEQEVRFMIEGISAVTLGAHEMPRAVQFLRAWGLKFCVATDNLVIYHFSSGDELSQPRRPAY